MSLNYSDNSSEKTAALKASPQPLILLAAADNTYALPLAVTLFSAFEHLRLDSKVKIYILDGGISSANRTRLERVIYGLKLAVHVEWIAPNAQEMQVLPLGSGEVSYLSKAMYFRLFAAAFIPESKGIYLDSDVLVRHNLEGLWQIDVRPYAAAVPEKTGATLGSALPQINAGKYSLEPDASYYNSGVLLINFNKWLSENMAASALAVTRQYKENIRYPDQDALNIILQRQWLTIDRRWNFQANSNSLNSELLPAEGAFIIHYSTRFKPWLKLAFGLERDYFNRYLRVLQRSGWFSLEEFAAFYGRLALTFVFTMFSSRLRRLFPKRSLSA